MATRSAKLYQGEDMSPVLDYTDYVIWEESEFGTRAWQGEGSASTVVIRDPLGEQGSGQDIPAGLTAKSLASKNLFVIDLDGEYMFRGRVGVKNYSRDDQRVERYRQVECSLHDTNWDLDHIFVNDYPRPAETDNARIQGIIASFLAGSPRATTALNGSNFLSGSNTVSLAEQTYNRTAPLAMIREISRTANKQFFVTGDTLTGGSLFWDGNDSTVYQAGLRISDRIDEQDTTCAGATSPTVVTTNSDEGTSDRAIALTVGNETDRVLYVATFQNPDIIVTWYPNWVNEGSTGSGGQALTNVGQVVTSPGTGTLILWRLIAPTTSGTETSSIKIDVPSEGTRGMYGAWLVQHANQTTPETAIATNTGTSAISSVTVTPADGGLILDAAGWVETNATVTNPIEAGDQTQDWSHSINQTFGLADIAAGGSHGSDATPAWSFTNSHPWAALAVAVAPSTTALVACTFPPIWNVGPASTEDGSEQLCEVVLFYGTNNDQYVTAHNLTTHNLYGHSSQTFTDDADISAATALLRAQAILAHRQYEDKTYNVTIGPLTDDQVLLVKHGQTLQIKARAIPDADDQFRTMRVVQCRYTTPVVGTWFAHLQLGRPWKLEPYGSGPTLVPTTAGELTLADAGGHFVGSTIEEALAEIGEGTVGGVSDHGLLTGLTDDDHTQYGLKRHGIKEVVSTVAAAGATETLDLANGNWHDVTLDANCTFTFTGATNGVGCSFVLILRQDGTGGWTPTWPASVEWPGGVTPTFPTAANEVSVISFLSRDGGTTWFGLYDSTAALAWADVESDHDLHDHTGIPGTSTPAFVGVRVTHSTTQSLTSGSSADVQLNTETFDTDGFHDTVTNNHRFTVPAGKAGKYLIGANAGIAANATGGRQLVIEVNDTTDIGFVAGVASSTASSWRAAVTAIYDLAEGDFVSCRLFQNSGGALDTVNANGLPNFWMHKIG